MKTIFFATVISLLGVSSVMHAKNESRDIISYNYETVAKDVPIYFPSTVEEAQSLILRARQNQVQVRFSGASHSTSSIILDTGIYIKSKNMNRILGVKQDPEHGAIVEVESGVKLGDLADYVGEKGYSLGFAYPYYSGLTIGGLLSTGSHGSSRKHTALSSQNIVEVTLVNGLGEIVTINGHNPEALKAARVSLGLLGFISKIKLKIFPDFNIEFRSTTLVGEKALLNKPGTVNWGAVADTEYFYWFPSRDRAVKVEGHITNRKTFPGAQSVVLGASNDGGLEDKISYQVLKYGMNHPLFNGWLEDYRFKSISQGPPPYTYIKDGKEVSAQGIVGPSSKMLISKRVPLNPVYTTQDIAFAFRVEDAPQVMGLIKEFCVKNDFYHPFLSVFLRFAHSNGENYLSVIERPGQSEHTLYVLAEFFEPKEYSEHNPPTVSSRLRDQLINLLASKNLITLHWGKNTDKLFETQANRAHLGSNIQEFEKVRRVMDPDGIFKNDFSEEFLLRP